MKKSWPSFDSKASFHIFSTIGSLFSDGMNPHDFQRFIPGGLVCYILQSNDDGPKKETGQRFCLLFGRTRILNDRITREIAKYWFLRCVACSEAAMTVQMAGFGIQEPAYEQALHCFSGGFMHSGHACGLLTGSVVAAGFSAVRRFRDEPTSSAATLYVAIELVKAHRALAGSQNCRDIAKASLTSLPGRLRYLQQGKARLCGRLHLQWAQQAQELIHKSFSGFAPPQPTENYANCAGDTLGKVIASSGMQLASPAVVAGLSGGVGLLGNVCGALSAGVFAISAFHYLSKNGRKRDSRFRGSLEELFGTIYKGPETLLRLAFVDRFGSDLCSQIIGRHFKDMEDHSIFIRSGGCRQLSTFIADWLTRHVSSMGFNAEP